MFTTACTQQLFWKYDNFLFLYINITAKHPYIYRNTAHVTSQPTKESCDVVVKLISFFSTVELQVDIWAQIILCAEHLKALNIHTQ